MLHTCLNFTNYLVGGMLHMLSSWEACSACDDDIWIKLAIKNDERNMERLIFMVSMASSSRLWNEAEMRAVSTLFAHA